MWIELLHSVFGGDHAPSLVGLPANATTGSAKAATVTSANFWRFISRTLELLCDACGCFMVHAIFLVVLRETTMTLPFPTIPFLPRAFSVLVNDRDCTIRRRYSGCSNLRRFRDCSRRRRYFYRGWDIGGGVRDSGLAFVVTNSMYRPCHSRRAL